MTNNNSAIASISAEEKIVVIDFEIRRKPAFRINYKRYSKCKRGFNIIGFILGLLAFVTIILGVESSFFGNLSLSTISSLKYVSILVLMAIVFLKEKYFSFHVPKKYK